eukprot:CAMPEP_0118671402 /NCGR_PEP_ID=MMETSP0785-20121206/21982_1 /TAXON_ID=91992 /ORGANISM="Bolidomonas pacifica, Strain CCMP 1866" /LENGTH=102 /DNA_ID=CAMNT_0006566283 /DNA_START=4 /DNA_END=309 /DNA_ORIENTATION=+
MTCFYVGQDGYHAERSRDLGGGKQIKVGRSVMKTLKSARLNVRDRRQGTILSLCLRRWNLGIEGTRYRHDPFRNGEIREGTGGPSLQVRRGAQENMEEFQEW